MSDDRVLSAARRLAWNLLYEERGLTWGGEADLTSMITEYIAVAPCGAGRGRSDPTPR